MAETMRPLSADPGCFKAYDIRGRMPTELNDDIAYRVGRAFVALTGASSVVVGHDIRHSSVPLSAALGQGLMEAGANVFDIGLCGTEEVYFATFDGGFDGGIMVTASHNPADFNGMKLVSHQARPISSDTGLYEIRDRVISGQFESAAKAGSWHLLEGARERFVDHLLGYVQAADLQPLRIVVNPGNGCAGLVLDELESRLPFELIKVHYQPDGDFPNGIPNPLLPERRQATANAVIRHQADLGLAWDGDFDRCFFFDEKGTFIEGYYLVGLLAEQTLKRDPGAAIVYDPRLVWNTESVVREYGGRCELSRSGHSFIKQKMRETDAAYGGEMSAHHYFRKFAYCDSGMIPWLLVAELVGTRGVGLSKLVDASMEAYPCSGEINFRVADSSRTMARVLEHYEPERPRVERIDGISLTFDTWRLNLRASNTEPLIRLNLETRGDREAVARHLARLRELIEEPGEP